MNFLLSLGHWRPLIRRLPMSGAVALTFDDGPTPETTPGLLRVLQKAQARATFFVSGVRAAAHPELVAALVEQGHSVYGHGWDHVNLERNPQRAIDDMRRVEAELSRHRPTPSTYLLRLPYNAGYARAAIHRAMATFHPNIQFAWWTHCTYDYRVANRCRTQADLQAECRAIADGLARAPDLDGGVILMHEQPFDVTSPFNGEVAGCLTPMILEVVAARGLRCVSMTAAAAPNPLARWILTPSRRSVAY